MCCVLFWPVRPVALERDVVEHVHAHVAKTGCTVCASRAEDASWCPDSNNMQIFDEPIQVSKRITYHQLRGALQPRRMRARSRHGRHSASGRAPKSCDAQTRGGRETERSTAHSGGCQKVRRTSTSPPLGNSDAYAPRHTSLSSASSRVFWQTLASEGRPAPLNFMIRLVRSSGHL